MAPLGCLAVENSVLIKNQNNCPHRRFAFTTCRRRKFFDSAPNGCKFGFSKVANGDVHLGFRLSGGKFCREKLWRSKDLRAISKNGIDGGDDDDDNSPAEDVLQETIAKSKKVLSMQRDLLQQIAERRKLVSSIKKSIVSKEQEFVSYNKHGSESDDSFLDRDLESTDGDLDTQYRSGSIFDHSYPVEILETPSVPISRDFDEGEKEKEPGKSSPFEKVYSDTEVFKHFRESRTAAAQAKPIPWLIPQSPGTYGSKDRKLEEAQVNKETMSGIDDEAPLAPVEEKIKPPPLAGANVMNIILVAAECAPWSKTGGLGDVAGALPKALARRGHRVMVLAPRYGNYSEPKETGVRKIYKVDGQDVEVTFYQAYIDGVDFVFMESHMFRDRENNIYGGNRVEILKRMVLFCKAAVEVPWHVPCGGVCYGDGNLVFIANDWHTALLPVYLKAYYRDNGLMTYTRCVLVIHNIAHQGRGPVDDFSYVDLPDHYIDYFKLYDPVGGAHFNIFAAGLKTADRVVTVSHGYSWEIKTLEGGWGLHGIINENDWKFKGIVNGIDTNEWNPKLDAHLKSDGYTNYSLEALQAGKRQCKAALQKELGLPVRDNIPLIGFIGRLDHQKGVDLIAEAIPWMMGQDVQLVMLGTGRPDLEDMLRSFENQHRDKVRGWVGFSVKMAHRITAGSDILLMPSRFEPCGLNQLYAMSYGTVPVVHAVGGLRDTVPPFDPYNESGLGWTFDRAEANRLVDALGNCLYTYREFKNSWEGIQKRGMMQDLSWDNAAQNYEEVLIAAKYHW
eukprot:TRINITY_DN1738_c0_g3_i1.p1 TRINITY_DN1738_c0_g3~~TRINITY_DN1738_c0_g3_i1.p1  ORF type:complete len:788 (-),score=160.77 TRINITY_DN1738_c0_g3_i1:145-2508(-)